MKFWSSIDAKDRRLMAWCLGITLLLIVAMGFLAPNGNGNDNHLPSSYLAGQHGARAAYETLLRANYPIERWERPLAELASVAGPDTVNPLPPAAGSWIVVGCAERGHIHVLVGGEETRESSSRGRPGTSHVMRYFPFP